MNACGGSSSDISQTNDDYTAEMVSHDGLTYSTLKSPYTGKIWLDRNMGASMVCTSFDDAACYGDYYQWGRNLDGHEKSTSTSTTEKATQIDPVQAAVAGEFIVTSITPDDWTVASLDDDGSLRSVNWNKIDGMSICPAGYRMPTITELKAETTDNVVDSNVDVFNDFLKLPSAGYRDGNGVFYSTGLFTFLWSNSVNTVRSRYLALYDTYADDSNSSDRSNGMPVRCLKD